MNSSVGIGIIGAGFLAETRARCYRQVMGTRIVTVASGTRTSAEDYAKRWDVDHVSDDYEALLAHPEVDAVDLCIPNLLHREVAVAAAKAGKHILCTKPLTAYVGQDLDGDVQDTDVSTQGRRHMFNIAVKDAKAMIEAAAQAKVWLAYGENWVYAPSVVRARGLLETSGGAVVEMKGWESHNGSHSPYSKSWRYTGGGALLRLGAHPIGAMLHLKEQEGLHGNGQPIRPVSVQAEVADLSKVSGLTKDNNHLATGWVDVENWGSVVIAFDDGSRGVCHGSDNMLGGMESRLEILASNCHLKCNLSPHDMLKAYTPHADVFGGEYIMEKVDSGAGWSTPMPDEDWSSGHVGLCQDFVAAVRDTRPPLATGELGRDVTRVVYGSYVSADEGRRVELNELDAN